MSQFFKKAILLSIPFLLSLLLYCIWDPFKVIYHYDSYYEKGTIPVFVNRDYASLETFENTYPKYQYDSYIFGNSRSMFYKVSSWQQYINSNKCFHFDASAESIYGIERKLDYLINRNVKIKNILIAMDVSVIDVTKNMIAPLYMKHYKLSNQNILRFHWEYLKNFYEYDIFGTIVKYKITGKIDPEYSSFDNHSYLLNSNELQFDKFEKMIAQNPLAYYTTKRMKEFYQRDSTQQFYHPVVQGESLVLLTKISAMLKEKNINYKIVINPLYDQKKLNNDDLLHLQKLFGKNNVYDFSGINQITNDYHNYYESSHYRPHVADFIMKSVYQ